jgi:hypothetical protein
MDDGHRNNVQGSSKKKEQKKKNLMYECDGAVILDKLTFVQLVKTITHI